MYSKKENLETFIGKNTHLKGNITTKGTLRLDGRVTGNVEADWLIIGEKALLKGERSLWK
jgi:cytoskeletal protein CcmA (bactofilin family)